MKRISILVALVVLLFSIPCSAGIEYEFQQVTRFDSSLEPPSRTLGRAVMDGDQSRVDYLKGSTTGAGQYVITRSGSAVLYIVNPEHKTYLVRDPSALTAGTVQRLGLKISNLDTKVDDLGPGPSIAGQPTHHYRFTASYDLTIEVGTIPLTKRVETTVEKWTTSAFPEIQSAPIPGSLQSTGNAEVDRLISDETSRIPGFPLQQIISVVTRMDPKKVDASSILKVKPSRTQRSEMVVTRIQRTTVPPATFEVPAGYTRTDQPMGSEDEQKIHILSMEDPQ